MTMALEPALPPCRPEGYSSCGRSRPAHLVRLKEKYKETATPSSSQQWLNERLDQQTLAQMHRYHIAICAPASLKQPAPFAGLWQTIHAQSTCESLEDSKSNVALIFCDPSDIHQVQLLSGFLATITDRTPTIFMVAHSLRSNLSDADEDAYILAIQHALQSGVDAVITGEAAGSALLRSVTSKIAVDRKEISRQEKLLLDHRTHLDDFENLKDYHHDTLFSHLRHRLALHLPPMDPNLGLGDRTDLDGLKVGSFLGSGAFAKVYKLEHAKDGSSTGQVLKTLPKEEIKSMFDLISLDRHIRLMNLISGTWSHPNLVKLKKVYHSETHVSFRMEDAGSMNLCKRLSQREAGRHLCQVKAKAIIEQAVAALAHMHLGPHIAHRDIKPENIIVDETEDQVTIKLADFDMAQVIDIDRERSTHCFGTYPFMAPELALQGRAMVFPTDIWSLGITFLELLCRLKCIERNVDGSATKAKGKNDIAARMKKIHTYFETPQAVTALVGREMNCQLKDMVGVSGVLLEGMLQTVQGKRWTVNELLETMPLLSQGVSESLVGHVGAIRKVRTMSQ